MATYDYKDHKIRGNNIQNSNNSLEFLYNNNNNNYNNMNNTTISNSNSNLYSKNLLKNQSIENPRGYNNNNSNSEINSNHNYNLNTNFSSQFNNTNNKNNNMDNYNSRNYGNTTDLEQEALNMIKSQKVKIQELVLEIERRDKVIESLTKKDISNEEERIVNDNAKRQVLILEDKLKLQQESEKKQLTAFAEKLSEFQSSETKSRELILSKDRLLHELETKLKERETQYNKNKKLLIEKESTCAELKQDLSQIAVQFKTIGNKLQNKEQELNQFKQDMNYKYDTTLKEKETLEERLNQLVEIVKQQSKELNELENQTQKNETENSALNKQNSFYNDDLIKKGKEINKLEAEKRHYHSLLQEKTELLAFEKQQLEKIRVDYDRLSKSHLDLEAKYNCINKEKDEFVGYINKEIDEISQWVDTYLACYFNINYDIPDMPCSFNKNFKNITKIDDLKQVLSRCRGKLNHELASYNENLTNMKEELSEYMNEKERFIIEKSNIKTELIKKQEEVIELSSLNEDIQKTILLQESLIKKIQNESGKNDLVAFDNIGRMVSGVLNLLSEYGYVDDDNSRSLGNIGNINSFKDNKNDSNSFTCIIDNVKKLEKIIFTRLLSSNNSKNTNNSNFKQNSNTWHNNNNNSINYNNNSNSNDLIKDQQLEQKQKEITQLSGLLKDQEQIESRLTSKIKYLEEQLDNIDLKLEDKEKHNYELNNEITLLNNKIYELKNVIDRNASKTNTLNSSFGNSNNNINNNNDDKQELEFYMSKCKSLSQENEFKSIQVLNLEEMVERRNKEIEEINRKILLLNEEISRLSNNSNNNKNSNSNIRIENNESFGNNNNNNTNNTNNAINSQQYSNLEREKDKLIKDNISLMKLNVKLSNQIKQLMELHQENEG